jgi:diguanylate cyclase (GGDEF)-like protein
VSLIEYTRLTRSALVLNQPAQDSRFAHSVYLQQRRPKSALCLPVMAQGQLVALVYLENKQLEDAFTLRHQQTLALLSAQAAISLVNARLYESLEEKVAQRTEELRQMSMKDGLTGIANRRAFDERLALEWRRSLRNAQPLSLLMIDIDHFKQYNDHHGHLEGDRCIQAVAGTLVQAAARSSDLVARYGGEEFALLLPATDNAAALEVAQACLAALAQRALPHPGTGGLVSLSVGVATVDVGAADLNPQALIERADQALYRAKRGGRNRLSA